MDKINFAFLFITGDRAAEAVRTLFNELLPSRLNGR